MMPHDDRNVLDVLNAELNFVQKGGYGRSPRDPFRAQLIFEDSPTCMNYDTHDHPAPCSECVLMQFVPLDKRAEKVPCRHIPLTTKGETVFDLYQGGLTQPELEEALTGWLTETISHLAPVVSAREAANRVTPAEGVSEQRVH
jgi:hypothetical protein